MLKLYKDSFGRYLIAVEKSIFYHQDALDITKEYVFHLARKSNTNFQSEKFPAVLPSDGVRGREDPAR